MDVLDRADLPPHSLSLVVSMLVGKAIARPIGGNKRSRRAPLIWSPKIGRFDLDEIDPLRGSRIRELDDQAIVNAMNTALDGLRAFGKYVPTLHR